MSDRGTGDTSDTDPTGGAAYDPSFVAGYVAAYNPDLDDPLDAPLRTPPPKKKSRKLYYLVALVALLVGAAASGAIVAAVKDGNTTKASDTGPATLAQSSATATPSATLSPTPTVATTNCAGFPTPAGLPVGTFATPVGTTCALVLPSGYATATAKTSATPTVKVSAIATAKASATAGTACTAADFQLSLSTDHDSYGQTANVGINAAIHALRACTTPAAVAYGRVNFGSANGALAENFAGCGYHDGVPSPCPAPVARQWKAGETESYTDVWSQQVSYGYVAAGTYVASLVVGPASTSASFTITQAPACTAAMLTATFTSDKTAYSAGTDKQATFTAKAVNTSGSACNVDLDAGQDNDQITDASGAVIWKSGVPGGAAYAPPVASVGESAQRLVPVAAGAAVPRADSSGNVTTAAYTFTWAFAEDGTQSRPSPSPAPTVDASGQPPATYTAAWGGIDGLFDHTQTVKVTLAG